MTNKKIGIIIPANIWFAPYLNIYTNLFQEISIDYDIISWNRDGTEDKTGTTYSPEYINSGLLKKIRQRLNFYKFTKKIIRKNKYDRLVVFGSFSSIFLLRLLIFNYKRRYIIDIRDLSVEQNLFSKFLFKVVINNSYANVISSRGFIKHLPKCSNYFISHNFDKSTIQDALNKKCNVSNIITPPIHILTIGGIRDYISNLEIIKKLANNSDYQLSFVGKGYASPRLKDYVDANNINNVSFRGYYEKQDEYKYINECHLLNIYYPKTRLHSSAMSNRFYHSLVYCKPMIVTNNSIQGDLTIKYKLGITIDNCKDIDNKIKHYLNNFDTSTYLKNRKELLTIFYNDYLNFEKMLLKFTNHLS